MCSARRLAALTGALALVSLVLPGVAGAQAQQQRVANLRIPFPQDDGSLTPYTFRLGYPFVSLIYDTVMLRDAAGVPRPWLARSVQRDGSRLTIQLRRGISWQDGRPLTAGDVVFTFAYFATHRQPRFTPQLRDIVRAEAAGSHTVEVTLRRPSLGFADQPLSDVPILPAHLWRDVPPGRLAPPGLPIGSGPYRLVRHRRGKGYRFVENRGYFRGRPAVRRIDVPIIRRARDAIDALEQRKVDALPVSLTPEASRDLGGGLGIRVVRGPSYLGTVLMLNTRRPPFDRPAVRRAVARALDLGRIARTLSNTPAERPAVPADRGYLHPASGWAPRRNLHRFAPAQTRVAITELGLPPIRILAPRGDPIHEQAGRQVVLALRRAGAAASLRKVSPAALARAVGQDRSTLDFEAAIWTAPALASYDPSFLGALFGGPDAPLNYSGYASAPFQALLDRAAEAETAPARRRVVQAALARLATDAPVIPLFFADGTFGYRSAVYNGWVFVRGSGILDKQSFLRHPVAEERDARAPVGDPLDRADEDDSDFPAGVFGITALAVLAAALAYAAWSRVRRQPR